MIKGTFDKYLLKESALESMFRPLIAVARSGHPSQQPATSRPVAAVIVYHDRSQHHPERYANGPQGLDWATQPNPFRSFTGAPRF